MKDNTMGALWSTPKMEEPLGKPVTALISLQKLFSLAPAAEIKYDMKNVVLRSPGILSPPKKFKKNQPLIFYSI